MQRFFRTPKGILLLLLAAAAMLGAVVEGAGNVAPVIVSATVTAVAVDVVAVRLTRKHWAFPSGAILTGLIIALVLSPAEPWPVPFATAWLAIVSKHLFRLHKANVFNPAALALIASALLFGAAQSWWGALPGLGPVGALLLIVAGGFVADRINKLPLVLIFLGAYFLLFTEASLLGESAKVAEMFRAPDLHAVLFFAFFMLDDPPTCPVRYRDQTVFGVAVAMVSYVVFMLYGTVYFLLAGLVAGNVLEAGRRAVAGRRVRRPAVRTARLEA